MTYPRHRFAKGRRRYVPGQMNKTEQAYASFLEEQRKLGYIDWYSFEAIKFKLADKTYYSPDFLVMRPDDSLECHEVKGAKRIKGTDSSKPYVEDDAMVKIKCAAEKFPFKFLMCWCFKGAWETREI